MSSDTPSAVRFQFLKWPILKPLAPQRDAPAIRVNRCSCVVGDRSRVHLPLRSPLVSRSHALIIVDHDEVYVRDLASRNRLFVNDVAVRETSLRQADLIQIGPFRFRCYAGFKDGEEDRETKVRAALTNSRHNCRLHGRTLIIGSRQECDLPLGASAAAPVHAVIFRRSGKHFIRDLNSKGGTFVNARRVREAELDDGDELWIAGTALYYRVEQVTSPSQDALGGKGTYDSWCGSEIWSSASAALSASRSVGAQTIGYASESDGGQREPAAAGQAPLLEPLPATADDFGFDPQISVPPPLSCAGADAGLVTAAELFPPEISLPAVPPIIAGRPRAAPPGPVNGKSTH